MILIYNSLDILVKSHHKGSGYMRERTLLHIITLIGIGDGHSYSAEKATLKIGFSFIYLKHWFLH